ncbi:MAG: transglutaminase-like cysteine peptidase, partial [Notoacmeibacter sp.]|nr:transglutaminase-like cysteine peptidase [Notoacmeibacter sp.]
ATDMGDFILDNLEPRVLAWDKTEYRFLKRQSSRNAGVWVSINDSRTQSVGSIRR